MKKDTKIVLFNNKKIRRSWYENQWFFSVVDIVGALADSINATDYLKKYAKEITN